MARGNRSAEAGQIRRLGRDAILAVEDVQTIDVFVPEWNTNVLVRGLTGAERDAYELSITQGKGKDQSLNIRNARAKLLVICCVDEEGNKLFQQSDIALLGQKSAVALERLFDAARKVSGLTEQDVEELTESFEVAQVDASPTA